MDPVHVAVGVIASVGGDSVLLSLRHPELHQGGLWEFPGGKVEAGESLRDALARELYEELGIELKTTEPLLEVRHDYGDKQVLLDVMLVKSFEHEPVGREGQQLRWVSLDQLADVEFPAANLAIVQAILTRRPLL